MIVTNEFLQKLKDFGLNSYEVKLWVSLLSRGSATAGELSDIANVPRSRTYDVLESLEKKGFIIMKIGKPIKYLAIEPNRVVDVLKKNIQTEAVTRSDMIENLKGTDVLKELSLLHTNGIESVDSTELSGAVRGRSNLYSHIEGTLSNAEKTVSMMTTATGFVEKVSALKPVFEKLARRGVKIRIATQITKENKELVAQLKGVAEVRHTEKVGRFLLVDGTDVLFMIMDDSTVHPTYDVGIWVNTPFFTQTLESLFDLAWDDLKIKA